VQAKLGRFDEAGGSFDLILDTDPFNPEAWNNMGVIFAKQDCKEEAIQHFRRALEAWQDYKDAMQNLEKMTQEGDIELVFTVAEMILKADVEISFTAPRPAIEPLKGEFMGFQIPYLLDFLKYLKEMIAFLPKDEQDKFVQSSVRFNMDHIINMFEGHKGILREIQDWKHKHQTFEQVQNGLRGVATAPSQVEPTLGSPDKETTLNAAEITDFLSYLRSLTMSLPDSAVSELLSKKMSIVASAMQ
jgi:tetratricopeptide (TPR) repeat protein